MKTNDFQRGIVFTGIFSLNHPYSLCGFVGPCDSRKKWLNKKIAQTNSQRSMMFGCIYIKVSLLDSRNQTPSTIFKSFNSQGPAILIDQNLLVAGTNLDGFLSNKKSKVRKMEITICAGFLPYKNAGCEEKQQDPPTKFLRHVRW